ncbi:MAG: hypothetical protein AAF737_07215, partial [Pseudomonadota bacterium]
MIHARHFPWNKLLLGRLCAFVILGCTSSFIGLGQSAQASDLIEFAQFEIAARYDAQSARIESLNSSAAGNRLVKMASHFAQRPLVSRENAFETFSSEQLSKLFEQLISAAPTAQKPYIAEQYAK